MKILSIIRLCLVSIIFFITACASTDENNRLKLGTIVGPETEILEVAIGIAKERYDLDVQIVPFTDYILPNTALVDGSIDVNAIQHIPYLEAWQRENKVTNLVVVGKTFVFPIAAYSEKYDTIAELPNRAIVALPNDPSNQARALLLLEEHGLITLNKSQGLEVSILDIRDNPKHLRFKELDAAQLPRTLRDVDLAVINNTFARPAGLTLKQGIIQESPDSPYANIIVTRADKQNDPRITQLVDSIQSDAVLEKAKALFEEGVIAAW